MFDVATTPVMFVGLIVLFAWCVIWSLVEVLAARSALGRVSAGLHLLMSVVMLAMVPAVLWTPLHTVVGYPVLIGLFVAAAVWFAWLALRPSATGVEARRGHAIGHTIMFVAMAWHLTSMAVLMGGMQPDPPGEVQGGAHGAGAHGGGGHGGGGPGGHGTEASAGGHHDATASVSPALVLAWIGLPLMVALIAMGIRHLVAVIRPPAGHVHHAAGGAGGVRAHEAMNAAMNLGMFWMSVGLLTPVAPFLSVLHV